MIKLALIGNPNVGKSTIYNSLTKSKVHTGNWSGKTISNNYSKFKYKNNEYILYDLPGIYSLIPHSKDEKIAKDFISSKEYDILIIVCDACILERNLNLVLQTLEITNNVIVVINLMDEAKKKKIDIDIDKLNKILKIPIVSTCAKNNIGINNLLKEIDNFKYKKIKTKKELSIEKINEKSNKICNEVVKYNDINYNKKDRKLDKILTNKLTGIPIMLIFLLIIFYLTISFANYPSNFLYSFFDRIKEYLFNILNYFNINQTIIDLLLNGIYKTTTWIISVMFPPMCIFFPIFTLFEDYGILPRIAFNMDKLFKKCNSCGKQALTMCMGFGCNAVGITSTRIINSKRERLIAIITNNFVPCNGRFPTIIAIISMFFVSYSIYNSILSTFILTLVILLGIIMTFIVSKFLSVTFLKGIPSSFILELPAYRKPKIFKTIFSALYDKALKILIRALIVAIPAGIIIWILSNIYIGNISLFKHITIFLDSFGKLIGMDGTIILAFILAFPANEILIPIMLIGYLGNSNLNDYNNLSELKNILISNGWTIKTAICTIIFSIMHFPCSTTCITIKKETGSFKWTILSILIPTILGIITCFLINLV